MYFVGCLIFCVCGCTASAVIIKPSPLPVFVTSHCKSHDAILLFEPPKQGNITALGAVSEAGWSRAQFVCDFTPIRVTDLWNVVSNSYLCCILRLQDKKSYIVLDFIEPILQRKVKFALQYRSSSCELVLLWCWWLLLWLRVLSVWPHSGWCGSSSPKQPAQSPLEAAAGACHILHSLKIYDKYFYGNLFFALFSFLLAHGLLRLLSIIYTFANFCEYVTDMVI